MPHLPLLAPYAAVPQESLLARKSCRLGILVDFVLLGIDWQIAILLRDLLAGLAVWPVVWATVAVRVGDLLLLTAVEFVLRPFVGSSLAHGALSVDVLASALLSLRSGAVLDAEGPQESLVERIMLVEVGRGLRVALQHRRVSGPELDMLWGLNAWNADLAHLGVECVHQDPQGPLHVQRHRPVQHTDESLVAPLWWDRVRQYVLQDVDEDLVQSPHERCLRLEAPQEVCRRLDVGLLIREQVLGDELPQIDGLQNQGREFVVVSYEPREVLHDVRGELAVVLGVVGHGRQDLVDHGEVLRASQVRSELRRNLASLGHHAHHGHALELPGALGAGPNHSDRQALERPQRNALIRQPERRLPYLTGCRRLEGPLAVQGHVADAQVGQGLALKTQKLLTAV